MKLIIKERADKSEVMNIVTQYSEGIKLRITKMENSQYSQNSVDIYMGDKQLTSFCCNNEDTNKLKAAFEKFSNALEICVEFNEQRGKTLVSLREFSADK